MKKKYTNAEKISIVKEGARNGVKTTLEKYGLYPATYYYWKKKYESMGDAGMDHGMTKERLQEIQRLQKENAILKQIIADKELEVRLQQDLIKKSICERAKGISPKLYLQGNEPGHSIGNSRGQ